MNPGEKPYLYLQENCLHARFNLFRRWLPLLALAASASAQLNRFNGLGVGLYATGNGSDSQQTARFCHPQYEAR